jgi:bacillithiol biosynthesis cysteine-adding enzyme BshC
MPGNLDFVNSEQAELLPITRPAWLDFRHLPMEAGSLSQLFLDYLYDFALVRRFFPLNFRENTAYEQVIAAHHGRHMDRSGLVQILMRQNKFFGCGDRTLEQIALLERPTTFAVVTGQQVGLFGGPMYVVFKTITAIKLADRLKAKFPQFDFVPVFWVEGEDHDFEEMNNIGVIDSEGKLLRLEYLHGGVPLERNPGPVGEMVFDTSLEQTFTRLEAALHRSEFTQALISRLRECYTPGRTFNQAFVAWMNVLFEDFGLVFLSSNDTELKRRLSPLFMQEIAEFPRTSQLLIARSAELEERYHAQIKPKSVNLFLFHKGGRFLIEPREHDFSLRGTRHFIPKEDLLRIAAETPELLSPNVVLRPIVQDSILPTVAYVAGPSEVAYNAQLQPVYDYFKVVQPVVYPRTSGSFVEERIERVAEKYQLDISRLFNETESITKVVVEQVEEIRVDDLFAKAQGSMSDVLNELQFGLREIDPTLLGALDGVKAKINANLSVLKEKALNAQKRRNETAVRQVERATGSLLPNGRLQEREISILYYMNKYGTELVKWLHGELEITGFKHQLIRL